MKDSLIRKLKGMATTDNILRKTKNSHSFFTYKVAMQRERKEQGEE